MIPFLKDKRIFDYVCCLAVLVLGAAIYSNTFAVPFHFDDDLTIVENNLIRSLSNLALLWKLDPSRFLTYFSFALNYYYGKLDTAGYHAVNLVLHLSVTVLVYVFVRFVTALHPSSSGRGEFRFVPLLTTLIFVSHPLQTQAVTYISQRSTLLAALFFLGTMICYFLYRRDGDMKFYIWAAGLFFIGLFTKPNIVTLPLALVLVEFLFRKEFKSPGNIVKLTLPFFLMTLTVPALLAIWKYQSVDWQNYLAMTRESTKISRYDYLLTQFNVMITYVRLLFVPLEQNLDYDYPIARSFFVFPTWLSFAGVCALLAFAVRQFKKAPLVGFGILWMFVTLSLESSIFPISDVINEHRLYLPMAGFGLAAAVGLSQRIPFRTATIGIAGVVVVIYSVLSFQRNAVWVDKLGFWQDVARKSPNKARVHNNLGIIYADKKQFDEAIAEYRRALELDQAYAHPHNNLANIYYQLERYDEARAELARAIEIDPDYHGGYYNLGNVAWAEDKVDEALEHYAKAVELRSSFVPALVTLGKCYRRKGDTAKGEVYFRAAIRMNPDYASAYSNLADMYLGKRQFKEALWYYQLAIQRDDKLIMAMNNMANIYDMLGAFNEAVNTYREIIARDPNFANAYFNLANTLGKTGRHSEARILLEQAVERYRAEGNEKMVAAAQQRLWQLGGW